MALPSGEASSESQVPSSVVNSTLRSDFSGRPFFSSFFSCFLSSFFSCFLSVSCAAASWRFTPASSATSPPNMPPRAIANTTNHAVLPRRLDCFAVMLVSPVPVLKKLEQKFGARNPVDYRPGDRHTLFLAIRRKPHGSVSPPQEVDGALRFRLLITAAPAARLRRRRNDVGNARVVHLFIQRGKFLIRDFLDLCRSIIDQRRQFRELFFLVPAGGGGVPVPPLHPRRARRAVAAAPERCGECPRRSSFYSAREVPHPRFS